MSLECRKVEYRGHVQGVGFRFTVQRLASDFDVGGFVRNEPDGSVLVVAEGENTEVTSFLDAIDRSALGGYISDKSVEEEPSTGKYAGGFNIEYWR